MTPMDAAYGIKLFGALFAIMNPLVNLPIFLSLTEALTPAQQRRTALQVMLYTTVMCAVVAVAGQQILGFFGISVEDFRVAGGVVLGGIALHMLSGGGNPMHEGSSREQAHQNDLESVAFYPMTFPMLVGPARSPPWWSSCSRPAALPVTPPTPRCSPRRCCCSPSPSISPAPSASACPRRSG
jgi:MarC family membrane protein